MLVCTQSKEQLDESSAHGHLRLCVSKTPSSVQLFSVQLQCTTYEAGVQAAQLTAVTSASSSRHTAVKTLRDAPNIVCRTTAFPNPSGICQKQFVSTLLGATPGDTTTTHDTKPQLGGSRIFSYLGNEARGHKGKGAECEIEKFILACSVHHPSTTSSQS